MTAPHLDPDTIALGREALLDMKSISDALLYASLLTDDGFEVVHIPEAPAGGAVDAAVDGNRFASMASSIQALSEAVARELRIGSSEYVIIASARGHVIQLRVAGQPIVLGALFDDGEMLGKALTVARRCAQRLSTALAERASSAAPASPPLAAQAF
ncbi:roadblock/LC7 domain-containing protein [Frigoribacterium sp. 2-23]|uniref:roadblock/LC7 domain-containing protein n=1 Tax=Frigoribacterium sp. 2-23 TaxID=3415006 RepID=UPI003C702BBF